MKDGKDIIKEITYYYMNPDKYPNEKKKSTEDAIEELDALLSSLPTDSSQDENYEGAKLFELLCSTYSSDDASIRSDIRKSRADEEGLSATRGYKEIYFNEIIQNANDNTDGDTIEVFVSKESGEYRLQFRYQDQGFRTKNIIGLFNTEIHTKKRDLASTGKHGVGIKSLFYFVDSLEIESNIRVAFRIHTIEEDGQEKIADVMSELAENSKWDKSTKYTKLIIRFKDKEKYGEFHIEKLKEFIDLCCNKEVDYCKIEPYFFGEEQHNLIFDARALLFTDKNRGKKTGIKKMHFYKKEHQQDELLFSIVCEEETKEYKGIQKGENAEAYKVQKAGITYKKGTGETKPEATYKKEGEEERSLRFIVIASDYKEDKGEEQNFAVAFPEADKISFSKRRYYETYYIPEAGEAGLNLLINSKYSSIDRRRLTDDSGKEVEIKVEIDKAFVRICQFMVSESCQKAVTDESLKKDLSVLFHMMVYQDKDEKFIDCCCANKIDNRYLKKYEKEAEEKEKYLTYQRKQNEEKEEFEKEMLIQEYSTKDLIGDFEKYILKSDTIRYDKSKYISGVCEIYEKAFSMNNEWEKGLKKKLYNILNIAGDIRELIYFRIHGAYYSHLEDNEPYLTDQEVDTWISDLITRYNPGQREKDLITRRLLSIIGRYKLNPRVSGSGEITGASFYEYLFNMKNTDASEISPLKRKQEEEFEREKNEQFKKLKDRLLELRVNRGKKGIARVIAHNEEVAECCYEEGKIAFHYALDARAKNDACYDSGAWECADFSDTDKFEKSDRLCFLFFKKMDDEPIFFQQMKILYKNNEVKLMLSDPQFTRWRYTSSRYEHENILQKGNWHFHTFINIDFLRNIRAHNWEDFCFFTDFMIRHNQDFADVFERSGIFWIRTSGFHMSADKLPDIFAFFYEENLTELEFLNMEKNPKFLNVEFNITLDDKRTVEQNQCPSEYCQLLYDLTGYDLCVMQVNPVHKTGREIMYCVWDQSQNGLRDRFKLWGKSEWHTMGKILNECADKKIIILHNNKLGWREAVQKVLSDIENDRVNKTDNGRVKDVIGKCGAFLPSKQYQAIQGTEYDHLKSIPIDGGQKQRLYSDLNVVNAADFTCGQLIKIMAARGCQNHKCCCCGHELAEGKLIITDNMEQETKNDYPRIMEVACAKCWKLLSRSLKETKLYKGEDGYHVVYVCEIRNTHQRKEIAMEHKLCDGVRAICFDPENKPKGAIGNEKSESKYMQ